MNGNGDNVQGFHPVDYALFAITIIASLGVGLFAACSGGKQKTTSEYLMGNRQFRILPVTVSIVMSFVSAILVLGYPAEMYYRGGQLAMSSFITAGASAICAFVFVPLFYPLKLTSSFEYLSMRYGTTAVTKVAVFYMISLNVCYMGVCLFAPATALESVTGFPTWGSILASGAVATVYTTLGGMKAVIWTDFLQGMIYLAGLITVCIMAIMKVGGVSEVWQIAEEGGRLKWFDFNPNPAMRLNFWSLASSNLLSAISTLGIQQAAVQRYCAVPTMRKAQMTLILKIPFSLVLQGLTCFAGITVYAFYSKEQCDPLKAGYISSSNQILPYFVMDVISYPGIPGLFLAVLCSGALSSISSSLSGLSAIIWKDTLEWKFHYLREEQQAFVTKCIAFAFGIIAVGMAFIVSNIGGHVLQISHSFTASSAAPLTGLFILGAFYPRANSKGAIIGSLCGFTMAMTCAIGMNYYNPYREKLPVSVEGCYNLTTVRPDAVDPDGVPWLFRLSFKYFSVLGFVITIVFGIIISHITGATDPETVPENLLIRLDERLCCYIPQRIRDKMFCRAERVTDDDNTEKHSLERKGSYVSLPDYKTEEKADIPL